MTGHFLISLFILVLLFSGGCANYQIPETTAEHPANPHAQTVCPPEQIGILNVDEEDIPEKPAEMKSGGMKHMQSQSHHQRKYINE